MAVLSGHLAYSNIKTQYRIIHLGYNSIGPAPMIHFQHTQWLSLRKLYLSKFVIK